VPEITKKRGIFRIPPLKGFTGGGGPVRTLKIDILHHLFRINYMKIRDTKFSIYLVLENIGHLSVND
jgi:hypothetical protein